MTTYYFRNVQTTGNVEVTGASYDAGQAGGSTKNNGGVMLGGGTVASSKWVSRALGRPREHVSYGPYDTSATGLLIVDTVNTRWTNDKAFDSRSFATMTAGQYIAKRLGGQIAGTADTTLKYGGGNYHYRRSIHKIESWHQTFLSEYAWTKTEYTLESPGPNYAEYTPVRSNYSSVDSTAVTGGLNWSGGNPASQGSSDVAANPTRAQPGQLVYGNGTIAVVLKIYAAKVNG